MTDIKYTVKTYKKAYTTSKGTKFYKWYGICGNKCYKLNFKKSVYNTLEIEFPSGLAVLTLNEGQYFIKNEKYLDKNGTEHLSKVLVILEYEEAIPREIEKETLPNNE